jgi:hypothetical protein
VGLDDQGQPDVFVAGEPEVPREDADHCRGPRVDPRRSSHDVRGAAEGPLPHAVSDEDDRIGARGGIGGCEATAEERIDAQRLEDAR